MLKATDFQYFTRFDVDKSSWKYVQDRIRMDYILREYNCTIDSGMLIIKKPIDVDDFIFLKYYLKINKIHYEDIRIGRINIYEVYY